MQFFNQKNYIYVIPKKYQENTKTCSSIPPGRTSTISYNVKRRNLFYPLSKAKIKMPKDKRCNMNRVPDSANPCFFRLQFWILVCPSNFQTVRCCFSIWLTAKQKPKSPAIFLSVILSKTAITIVYFH
jgi:hypothetical protein